MAKVHCQVVEAKEAGAAGVIGVVANVLGNGSPIMTSFAAAIGLDAPLEASDQASNCTSTVLCVKLCARNMRAALPLLHLCPVCKVRVVTCLHGGALTCKYGSVVETAMQATSSITAVNPSIMLLYPAGL